MALFDDLFTDDIANADNLRRLIEPITIHYHLRLVPTVSVYEPDDEDTVKNEEADNEVTL
jgi:hypothetical protein